jgi:hypothetical protein
VGRNKSNNKKLREKKRGKMKQSISIICNNPQKVYLDYKVYLFKKKLDKSTLLHLNERERSIISNYETKRGISEL